MGQLACMHPSTTYGLHIKSSGLVETSRVAIPPYFKYEFLHLLVCEVAAIILACGIRVMYQKNMPRTVTRSRLLILSGSSFLEPNFNTFNLPHL
jgi:hypothetical protein